MKRRKNRQEEIPADISENQEEKKPRKRFGRKRKTDQIIRIEELEELMSKYGEGADPEDVVSMYIPHRKRRKIGAALLQLDRMQLLLVGLLLLVAILFITAFMQEKMGTAVDEIRRRFGFYSIQRGLMYRDRILSAVNAKEEHTVHPHGYFSG